MRNNIQWNWYEDIEYNEKPSQMASQINALTIKDDFIIHFDKQSKFCKICNKDRTHVYDVSLNGCTCPDFINNYDHVCKHMYKLAYKLNIMTPLTLNQQKDFNKLDKDFKNAIKSNEIKAFIFKIIADDDTISRNVSVETLLKQLLLIGYKYFSKSTNKELMQKIENLLK